MNRRLKQWIVLFCVLACLHDGVAAKGQKGRGRKANDADPGQGVAEAEKGEISTEGGGGPAAEEEESGGQGRWNAGSEPDLTKGVSGNLASYALGSTGIMGLIWSETRISPTMVAVGEVLPGSPASGKLDAGDVIIGLGSGKFSNLRRELSAAITEAEKQENGGKLVLNVWRKGKPQQITLTLDVKGTYSATSPWDCKKTDKLITESADWLADNMPGGIAGNVAVLGLLATGEKKYQRHVSDRCRKAAQGGAGGPWNAGYKLIMLSEYCLATGDSSVKSGIRTIAERVARGQSKVGTYGHGYAGEYGQETGYGCMNQCSITCILGMVLARKCGINSPEVDRAVAIGTAQLRWYNDKGRVPYGFMNPIPDDYDSNGRTAQTAVLFDIYGDSVAAESFARCSLASWCEREGGHTGHYWNQLWGQLGAARGGPEAAHAHFEKTLWFMELERRHNGQFHYQPHLTWKRDPGKYKNWDMTGARLLHLCLPRRAIYLTGKGGSSFEPLTGKRLEDTLAHTKKWSPKGCSVSELLDNLGSWSWRVRRLSADELAERNEDVSRKVVAMLDSPDRLRRFGACMAVRRVGGSGNWPKVRDKMLRILETSKDTHEQYFALVALRYTPFGGGRGFKEQVFEVAPDLMRLAVKLDADPADPIKRVPAAIVQTLWAGSGPKGWKGYNHSQKYREIESTIDNNLLVSAVAVGLRNPDGGIRSCTGGRLKNLDANRLEKIWGDIWFAASTPAIGNAMFAEGGRTACKEAIGRGGFEEGIELAVHEMTRGGWGGFKRIPASCKALANYGSHIKPYLPEMQKTYDQFVATRKPSEVENMKAAWAAVQANLDKKVELKSIKQYIKDVPDSKFTGQPLPANGGGRHSAEPASQPAQTTPAVQPVRKARSLSAENRARLDKALISTLTKLSDSGALKEIAIKISLTRAKVWLKSVAGEELTFQVVGGTQTAPFKWEALGPPDRATLALLVATLKSDSPDAQAMAGVYLESFGRAKEADAYFEKAGEDSSKKLQKLFD